MSQLLINQQQSIVNGLKKIVRRAREKNPNLPIYVYWNLLIPFYLNFPERQICNWLWINGIKETESRTRKFSGVYFVPINDLLYKGLEGNKG